MRPLLFGGGERGVVLAIACVRLLSVAAEIIGLVLISRSTTVARAMRVNSALGLAGPCVFVGASLLGLASLAGRINPWRLLLVLVGVALVFAGTAAGARG